MGLFKFMYERLSPAGKGVGAFTAAFYGKKLYEERRRASAPDIFHGYSMSQVDLIWEACKLVEPDLNAKILAMPVAGQHAALSEIFGCTPFRFELRFGFKRPKPE